jgi:DNA-binding CsgD family transcriptional regulator
MPESRDWREIVGIAVVAGDTSPETVSRIAAVSMVDATAALDLAAEHGIISGDRIDEPAAALMLADLGPESTARLHLQVAVWMLIHGWNDVAELIRHARTAAALVPVPEIIERLEHAARVALSTSDYNEARQLLELVEDIDNLADVDERAWRMCRLAEAYDGLGQVTKARQSAGRAFDLAEIAGNVEVCLEASVLSVFPTDWHAGDFQASALLQRLSDLGPPPERQAVLHAAQAIAQMRIPVFEHAGQQVAWVTRATVAQPLADKAVEHRSGTSPADRLLAVLAWRTCHRAPQFLERRRALSLEALDLSQQLNQRARQVEAACFLAVDAVESHDWGLYERALSVARWVAGRDGNPRLLAHTRAMEAGAAFRRGDLELGTRLRTEAIGFAASVGLSSTYSLDRVLLAEHMMVLDEPPPASVIPTDDDPIVHHPLGRAVVAVGWARLGDIDAAARHLSQSLLGIDDESSMLLHLSVAAEAAVLIGSAPEIERLVELLRPWATHVAVDGHAWWPDRPVAAVLAELLVAQGDLEGASGFAAMAADIAVGTGDVKTVRRLAALEDRLAGATTSLRAAGTPLAALSQRQLQVLALVAQGLTNREISRELAFSVSTIKAEVTTILHTLGVSNRTQLSGYVARNESASGAALPAD